MDSVSLRHAGRELLRYVFAPDTPAAGSPRPYAHEVRTLGGAPVTGHRPADHPWHTGISVAVAHAGEVNLWGGPTYVDGSGYVDRDDHGVIRHDRWASPPSDTEIAEELTWLDPGGRELAVERRTLRIDRVDEAAGHWVVLRFALRLRNTSGAPLALGSPATRGRAGAGYGGLFWRGAESFVDGAAHTPDGVAVNGAPAPWLAFTDAAATATVVFLPDPVAAEPWFVRTAEYPGVCAALAFDRPLDLAPDAESARDYRIVIADGRPGKRP
ncbi:PmoA family protein [Actinokineospora sp.]|uniref:PmoA family protein n=1 Tax=Actinokineospora sp. TaxID=1872133 RepID=UPI00403760FD